MVIIDENIPHLKQWLQEHLQQESIVVSGREITNQLLQECSCSALFVRSVTKVSKELLHNTSVKFVASATAGIDHVDTEYLQLTNRKFAYAPGSNSNAVAEYTIASIAWWLDATAQSNPTLGIIGFGNIGSKVAWYAHTLLGCQVLVSDPLLEQSGFKFPHNCTVLSLNDLLSTSTIITNHVPLTNGTHFPTHNLIAHHNISLLQEQALIIHTSRGGVICEQALLEARQSKDIYFILDVWENEPQLQTTTLQQALIATPHIAGYTKNAKLNGALDVFNAYTTFLGIDKKVSSSAEQTQNSKNLLQVFAQRNLLQDTERMKELLNVSSENIPTQFFQLRKQYALQNESLIPFL